MDSKVQQKRDELVSRLRKANDIASANAVLSWDQSTYMPPAGAAARARQMATLEGLAHEAGTDPAIGRLLDELQPYVDSLPPDDDDAALVRVTRRNYERRTKVPAEFAAAFAGHMAETFSLWAQARPANDFRRVQPALEKTLDMSRQYANFFPGYQHIADPLIDTADYGMSAGQIGPLFEELRRQLSPLVKAIGQAQQIDDSVLHHHYPEAEQAAFGDCRRARPGLRLQPRPPGQDPSPVHDQVRLGRRTHHHALQRNRSGRRAVQQHPRDRPCALRTRDRPEVRRHAARHRYVGRCAREPVAPVGEHRRAQRRLLGVLLPQARRRLPRRRLAGTSAETFYKAVNKSQPSLIRTDADEVTYNLHVIIRFGLELDLLEGKLAVADLPEAWHARYVESLGVRAPDDRDGVLQDVHWYAGPIGGVFQGYTLGNIMASQFYAAALKVHPEIPSQIRQGEFDTLHTWLRENIYQHGSKYHGQRTAPARHGWAVDARAVFEVSEDEVRGDLRTVEGNVPGTSQRTLAFAVPGTYVSQLPSHAFHLVLRQRDRAEEADVVA